MGQAAARQNYQDVLDRLGGQSVVFVGLMGAGKTTIGRRVAQRLRLAFADADKEIERAADMTIQEIFEEHGEDYFRSGETRVISRLLDEGQKVLATGGGAFMNDDTRRKIKNGAISVWLKADLPLLMKRVRRKSHRPLLQTADPEAVMRGLVEVRYPVYAEADITIESRDVPHAHIVEDVLTALSGIGGRHDERA